jgi:hypothetical protein
MMMTMWECVDAVSTPGGPFTEDLLGRCGPLAWVIDGASNVSQGRVTNDEHSDACWLVRCLDEALRDLASESDVGLRKIVAEAIARIAAKAATEWDRQPEIPPSAALGVVRRQGRWTEYLVLADVSVILRAGEVVEEVTDQAVDETNREAHRTMRRLLNEGKSLEHAREVTIPLLAEARLAMNKEGGYWVASIDANAVEHARWGEVDGVSEVILASDGFMRVLRPFGLVPDVAALFDSGRSLPTLAQMVRDAEREDPETRRFGRWTASDDICAQRLRWIA